MSDSRLDGVRVLVVDDTRSVLDVITDMLKHSGAEVTAVGTAEEALDVLQRERPDVLLSDLSMPGKGGYWLIGQVLTAYTSAEHHASVIREGISVPRGETGRSERARRRRGHPGSEGVAAWEVQHES